MRIFEAPIEYWTGTELTRRVYELKLAVAVAVRSRRRQLGVSQAELARRLNTSQSRISKLEACRGHTTVDFALGALIALGASDQEIADAIDASRCAAVLHVRQRAARISFRQMRRPTLRDQIQGRL